MDVSVLIEVTICYTPCIVYGRVLYFILSKKGRSRYTIDITCIV